MIFALEPLGEFRHVGGDVVVDKVQIVAGFFFLLQHTNYGCLSHLINIKPFILGEKRLDFDEQLGCLYNLVNFVDFGHLNFLLVNRQREI